MGIASLHPSYALLRCTGYAYPGVGPDGIGKT